jgi:hypothetical protein
MQVNVIGAPPLRVTVAEVGLREPGTAPVVSEGGLELPQQSSCRVPSNRRSYCNCRGLGGFECRSVSPAIGAYRAVSGARDDKLMTSPSVTGYPSARWGCFSKR